MINPIEKDSLAQIAKYITILRRVSGDIANNYFEAYEGHGDKENVCIVLGYHQYKVQFEIILDYLYEIDKFFKSHDIRFWDD